jgi:hypothetical protein
MTFVFEIIDKTGRKIHLTKERWAHITSPASLHPYMTNYFEEVKQTLIKPDLIIQQKFDDSKTNYYKHIKGEKVYLLVGVKYLNGKGFVTTSFLTRKIMRK